VAKAEADGAALFVPVVLPPERERLLALNPRGTRLAVSCDVYDFVQVFDARTGREVTRCEGFRRIADVEFLSAEMLLVTASDGCFCCDLRRGKRDVLSSESWPSGTTVSPNGRMVALGVDYGLILYDARTRAVLRPLKTDFAWGGPDPAKGRCTAFSPGGRYVASALRSTYDHWYLVVVWELQTGRRQRIFDTIAHALAFRDDTLSLALADDWGHINIYERDQGEEPAAQFDVEYGACAMQYQADGRTLAVLLNKGSVIHFAAPMGRILRRKEPPTHHQLDSAVVSASWSHFAGATERGIVVWPGGKPEPRMAGKRIDKFA
jgi:WD40 repeat protein